MDILDVLVVLSPTNKTAAFGVSISPDQAGKTGDVLTDVVYTITVENTGNVDDTYDISKASETWTTVLEMATIGPISPGETDEFTVTVTVPVDVEDEDTDGVTITVTSQEDAAATDNQGLTTTANQLYLMYDTFTDENGVDLDDHNSEVGDWTEVDTGGKCDIQANKAQITGAGIWTDPLFRAGPFDRETGQELVFTIKPGQTTNQFAIGLWSGLNFDPGSGGDKAHIMWFYTGAKLYCREAAEPEFVTYTTDERECKIILKATGAEYWYNGEKIADLAVNSDDPLYIGVVARGGDWDISQLTYTIT